MSITAARKHLVEVRKALGRERWEFSCISQGVVTRRAFRPMFDSKKDNVAGYVSTIIEMPSFVAYDTETHKSYKVTLDSALNDVAVISDPDGFGKVRMSVYMVSDHLRDETNTSAENG